MKKNILKVVGIVVVLLIGVMVAIPFFLEAKIGDLINNNVNANVNAQLHFSDADLSLIRSFPNAAVRLQDVSLVNNDPFQGDTLFAAQEVALSMGLMQLFKSSGEPIAISKLSVDNALLHIKVDTMGRANYDIAKETTTGAPAAAETTEGFSFTMESYGINNSKIVYDDFDTGMHLEVTHMNHNGTGDLSLATSELETHTEALVSFEMDSINYLDGNKVVLDALIGIDLNENKYSFLKNEALINQLPLVFEGFVKLNEDNQEVDISFKTPSSDFKNFLAVLPEAYSQNISGVTTTGDFVVEGSFTGVVDEVHIPKFNIKINSNNASFKYPDLPKTVQNIFIDMTVNNTTGMAKDTYVDLDRMSFMIDQDRFALTSKITELMGNTKVNAHLEGKMNLANLEKVYPVPADLQLKGNLDANVTTAFDMASIESKRYENTQTSGKMTLTGFEYRSSDFPQAVVLESTSVTFNPTKVVLEELKGKTGKTDFNINGSIVNFLGYLFNGEVVKGTFTMASNTFVLNDFMVAQNEVQAGDDAEGERENASAKIKVPAFLDATFNASANTVVYDNITLSNVKGQLIIRDEKAVLNNMTSSLFNGNVAFNGEVSTKQEVPTFAMKLNMDQLKIAETFKALALFEALAPVASVLKGNFTSDLTLAGNLNDDFTPDLLSLTGQVLAKVMTQQITPESAPVLSALDSKLNFIDLKNVDLSNLTADLSFEDGLVAVKPFTFSYKDVDIQVQGGHTFDKKMDYRATLQVPAKYLGSEINALLAQINEEGLQDLSIPITANIGGMYNNPQVTTDLTAGVKDLTNQLIAVQKQKLMDQGKSKAKDLIGGILKKQTETAGDTVKGDDKSGSLKGVLGDILTSGSKTDTVAGQDSVPAKRDEVKAVAKDILGGLFGKKKDTAKAKKDTIN
jgi:hypothetical protein